MLFSIQKKKYILFLHLKYKNEENKHNEEKIKTY